MNLFLSEEISCCSLCSLEFISCGSVTQANNALDIKLLVSFSSYRSAYHEFECMTLTIGREVYRVSIPLGLIFKENFKGSHSLKVLQHSPEHKPFGKPGHH